MKAAQDCGLDDAFVQIIELGNYAITYKTCGILADVKSLLTTRSNLCRCILDTLHGQGIEIMSPTIMNQRPLPGDSKIIPAQIEQPPPENLPVAEQVVFDKAEKAERIEKEKQQLLDTIQKCKNDFEGCAEDRKDELKQTIKNCQEKLDAFDKSEDESDQKSTCPGVQPFN